MWGQPEFLRTLFTTQLPPTCGRIMREVIQRGILYAECLPVTCHLLNSSRSALLLIGSLVMLLEKFLTSSTGSYFSVFALFLRSVPRSQTIRTLPKRWKPVCSMAFPHGYLPVLFHTPWAPKFYTGQKTARYSPLIFLMEDYPSNTKNKPCD